MGRISKREYRLKTGEVAAIRSAMLEDAGELLAHGRAVVSEGEFVLMHPDEFDLTEEQEQEWIRQYLDGSDRLLIVAKVASTMVGVLFFECSPRKRLAHRGDLHMSVSRDWRGRGVGTALLHSLIEWAESHPTIEKLSLGVFATNSVAIGLYRNHNFLEEGRQPREIKLGPGKYVDQILMYRFV